MTIGIGVVAGVAACCTAACASSTTFTDAGGTHLWSDATNWTNGLPDATTDALISPQGWGQVTADLGGQTWTARSIRFANTLESSGYVVNGTLRTSTVGTKGYPTPVAINLTALGDRLELNSVAQNFWGAQIGSPGDGAFDLSLINSTVFGDFWNTGRTLVIRDDDPVNDGPSSVTLFGTMHASRDIEVQRARLIYKPVGDWLAGTKIRLSAAVLQSIVDVEQLRVSGLSSFQSIDLIGFTPTRASVIDHL